MTTENVSNRRISRDFPERFDELRYKAALLKDVCFILSIKMPYANDRRVNVDMMTQEGFRGLALLGDIVIDEIDRLNHDVTFVTEGESDGI